MINNYCQKKKKKKKKKASKRSTCKIPKSF